MNLFDLLINHPGRSLTFQCINYHCTAATPPSKGEPAPLRRGETFTILSCHKTNLKLTSIGWGDEYMK